MTTIFVKNLKDLVAGQLKLRWSKLNQQLTVADIGPLKLSALLVDTTLSTQQADIIARLEEQVLTFTGTGDDEADKNTIKEWINKAYEDVEAVRGEHGFPEDGGTLKCLDALRNSIENFYTKIREFPFTLLNIPIQKTPESIVYTHACHYLGLSKFQEDGPANIDIRKRKEEALNNRLAALKKEIRPEYSLDDRKDATARALRDLERDNQDVVKPKKGAKVPLFSMGITLLGLNAKPYTSSLGSLSKEITLAQDEINAMTEDTYEALEGETVSNGL